MENMLRILTESHRFGSCAFGAFIALLVYWLLRAVIRKYRRLKVTVKMFNAEFNLCADDGEEEV
ncbi:TPA: hypothetical protein L0545_004086 [Citrobacter freundii]|uniref:Uncharacterized protein n=1 Tax=Citrobacter portucalensis TaxID=1639133 RepID=A0A9X4GML7_9ENTR|nr:MULTISPECIES: hypothetical protein [Citrobacter]HBM9295878.1 hypothetical protein [Citrobacter freundii]MDE9618307.1 hypothetical protein [Citrobacter portucalensis]MDM2949130.1 hypothetical protein [Citrobacter sp. CK207]MDM3081422.1 hypothetical protein [Citrobacter sp. Cf141]HBM9399734.1 hypothetical protein [Citrobacter freundii]